jgi:hypothetical protein
MAQDEFQFNASNVLELYRLRWTIETVFLHVTNEFNLRNMIESTASCVDTLVDRLQ